MACAESGDCPNSARWQSYHYPSLFFRRTKHLNKYGPVRLWRRVSPASLTHQRRRSRENGLVIEVGMWTYPPAIRETATGIFLWPAWGLYDTIKGDEFKHIDFSHDCCSVHDSTHSIHTILGAASANLKYSP